MNNKFKLPKLDIFFQFFTAIRYLIPFIFILFIQGIGKIDTIYLVLGVLLAIGLIVLSLYYSWKHFYYWFESDRIVIQSGVFNKQEKTIYYQKIHSVNLKQNIIQRLFKVGTLKIETPGGKVGTAEGELSSLPLVRAKQLQQLLQSIGNVSRNNTDSELQEQLVQTLVTVASSNTKAKVGVEAESIPQPMSEAIQSETEHAIASGISSNTNSETIVQANILQESKPDVEVKLDTKLMFKAAITSLNFGIVIAFFAGIMSFADDIAEFLVPDDYFDKLLDTVVLERAVIVSIIVISIAAIIAIWILSIVFYIIKYFEYRIQRNGQQISVTYGLLEKKSVIFDQTKVQAVIFEENPVRQMLGFGELKVQVITSNKDGKDTELVIHPYVHRTQIADYVESLMPKRALLHHKEINALPKASIRNYLLVPTLIALVLVVAAVIWLGMIGLWFSLLVPLIASWRYWQYKAGGISIEEDQMLLRKREFARLTYYVKKRNIVTLKQGTTPYQQKHRIRTLSLKVLGSMASYKLKGISLSDMEKARQWFSRRKGHSNLN